MALMTEVDASRNARLLRGNGLRLERAELLRRVRAGLEDVPVLILDPPACIATMFTFDFLLHVPRVGPESVREINRFAIKDQVNLAVTLGGLTGYRRRWLAGMLTIWQPTCGLSPLASRPQG